VRSQQIIFSIVAAGFLLLSSPPGWPQAPTTRLLVTERELKPERIDEWLDRQRREVVPALRQAGVSERVVYQAVIGETTTFVEVRSLPTFAEFDGPGPLTEALGVAAAARLEAQLRDCLISAISRIENRRDDFRLDPGDAGLITLNMHYDEFSPLDGPPPIAKTLGPEGTLEFIRKGAGLITGIQQLVYRRIPELSF
jgi:hypothetical protein